MTCLVGPGSPCQISDQNVQCGGNSICANGFCTCPGGEQIVNGVCESRDTEGMRNTIYYVSLLKG